MKAIIIGQSLARSKKVDYEVEELFIELDLPFIPTNGTQVKLTPEGEYYTVDQIFWDVVDPDRIVVYLEEEENLKRIRPFKEMRAQGWRIGTGPEHEEIFS